MYIAAVRRFVFVPTLLVALGFFFGGIFAIVQGNNARDDVRSGLTREQVTVSADAPNVALRNKPVVNAETAEAEADAIWMHTMKATGGKTYATIEKYLAADGKNGTNDAKLAQLDASGKPVANPARATAKDGAFLRTGLMLSVAAFGVAQLVVGLGWGFIALGLLLLFVGVPLAYYVPRLLVTSI